jgi:3-methyladenine DNA glycosylase AlkD
MSINYADLSIVRDKLLEQQDLKYKKFHENLVPGRDKIIGVRVPLMKALAKEIAKSGSALDYLEKALKEKEEYYEETLVQGLTIGFIKIDAEARLKHIKRFVPKIDNWAICDSFSANLKFTKKNMDLVWNFILSYQSSSKVYDLRFLTVMLMDHYVDDAHIDQIIEIYDAIRNDDYYVKMAVAWGLSVCFIKYPEKTMKYFKKNNLSDWTFNKALQKCVESRRVDDDTRDVLRSMKRK